ncbi:MAG: methylthioribulose 1-phosphate dehydratase [Alphaproteobacteria bacterium]|nr:methylthioribulose 1-phosphate dehydratase [Alphaproteobacteria bacterium]
MSTAKLPDFKTAAARICEAGRVLDSKNMAPATSGNYSMRLDDGSFAMTVSGFHKGRLSSENIMRVDADARPLEDKKPSAETLLHAQIYRLFPETNAILHVHSVPGAVLTRLTQGDVVLEGYEMLKIFPGIDTHDVRITLPVVPNSQDMDELSAALEDKIKAGVPAYLIRDHGFYVWAPDMEHCVNMCEALEYLLACEVETLKIKTAGARA